MYDNLPSTLRVQSGRLIAMAVAPSAWLPTTTCPTFAEAGMPAVNDSSWLAWLP